MAQAVSYSQYTSLCTCSISKAASSPNNLLIGGLNPCLIIKVESSPIDLLIYSIFKTKNHQFPLLIVEYCIMFVHISVYVSWGTEHVPFVERAFGSFQVCMCTISSLHLQRFLCYGISAAAAPAKCHLSSLWVLPGIWNNFVSVPPPVSVSWNLKRGPVPC